MSDPVNSVQYASFQISLIAEPVLPFWFTCVYQPKPSLNSPPISQILQPFERLGVPQMKPKSFILRFSEI